MFLEHWSIIIGCVTSFEFVFVLSVTNKKEYVLLFQFVVGSGQSVA